MRVSILFVGRALGGRLVYMGFFSVGLLDACFYSSGTWRSARRGWQGVLRLHSQLCGNAVS